MALNRKKPESCPLCNSESTSFFVKDYQGNSYWQCEKCKLVFQFPISPPKKDEENWTEAVDPDGRKRDLTKERDFKLKNWYGDIAQEISRLKPGKVLDIGCGLGYLLSALPDSWEKYGLEISPFAKLFVKKNYPGINLVENLQLDQAPPPEHHHQAYDVVVCYHVIEHIKKPDVFMENLSLLVKPGGNLIIGTPNIGSLVAKIFKGNFRLLGVGHFSLFNEENLEKLFNQYGFQVYKKEYPYFKTVYFNLKNILRLFNFKKVSPPFYGSIMTFYAQKKI